MSSQIPLPCLGEDYSERPLILENGGKVSAAVSRVEDCIHPVRSGLRCSRAVLCLTVAQLSVAPHGADSRFLSKCLTAAPLPCAACGLISLDERCRLRSGRRNMEKKKKKPRGATRKYQAGEHGSRVPFKTCMCMLCVRCYERFVMSASAYMSGDAALT